MRNLVFSFLILFMFSSCLKRVEVIEPSQFELNYNDKLAFAEAIGSDFLKN